MPSLIEGQIADGYWVDDSPAVALAHRRLSVVDLTPAGAQPMVSHCGNFVIVYNGEVYNSAEIADNLKDLRFRGSSDTEVILEACARWGVKRNRCTSYWNVCFCSMGSTQPDYDISSRSVGY